MTTIPLNTSDNIKHRETRFLSATQSATPVFSRGSPGALCLAVQGLQARTAAGLGTRPHSLSPGQSEGHSALVWLLLGRAEGRGGGPQPHREESHSRRTYS